MKKKTLNTKPLNDDFFAAFFEEKRDYIPWKTNGAYKIYYNVRRFFCSPSIKREINLLEQVESLLTHIAGLPHLTS